MSEAPAGRRVFVLGGGIAGIGAALRCADRGDAVTLLESRGWLGGRAFSSPDPVTGWMLDNGPHVMLGCYRELRALLRRLGSEAGFARAPTLALAYRTAHGRAVRLRLGGLPVPLTMPWALLRLPLPFAARLRALFGMGTVLFGAKATWTLADWQRRRGQRGEPDAFLWRPLCRAIMNVEPDAASARDFLHTLREAFLGSAAAAAIWAPMRPWQQLIGEPAARVLPAAGVVVRTGARVAALEREADRVVALQLADGERLALGAADRVVSALPWSALRALLPDATPAFGELRSAPIVSVFAESPSGAPTLPDDGPVTALVDGDPFHFVIRTPGGDARRFALLSGGGRSFDGQPVEVIAARARQQLARHYPGFAVDGLVLRVRKEQHATFVAAPGHERQRPAPGQPLPSGPRNLLVCGDWTATGLPATLESAARSAATL
ncbi:MAG: FAD-dependent oxidoreductase [Planctomycetes bacterium]|nr:FAD-dependent oxidoreductase [Planctomycetota bacterium]